MIQTLNILWRKKKRSLSKTLQKGITEIASILLPVSVENNLSQKISGNEIQWRNSQDKIVTLFFYINNPRKLQDVSKIFQRTQNTGCELTCIFVHQWTDGEGNWDVFGLHPLRGLFHWNRFWGIRHPAIEEVNLAHKEIYSLFNNSRNFPLISRKKWMILLEESEAKVTEVIVALADSFKCIPKMKANYVLWLNKTGKTVAIFFVYKGYPKLNDYYNIYKTIKDNDCPKTYLFQRAHPQVFDIFRFSELSYLEHCNQFK